MFPLAGYLTEIAHSKMGHPPSVGWVIFVFEAKETPGWASKDILKIWLFSVVVRVVVLQK